MRVSPSFPFLSFRASIAAESYARIGKEESTGQKSLEAINGPLETSPGALLTGHKDNKKQTRVSAAAFSNGGGWRRRAVVGFEAAATTAAVSADAAAAVRVGKPLRLPPERARSRSFEP